MNNLDLDSIQLQAAVAYAAYADAYAAYAAASIRNELLSILFN